MSDPIGASRTTVGIPRPAARTLLSSLLAVAGLFAVVYVLAPLTNLEILEALFDLNEEISIPTWWSSIQLLVLSALLALLARQKDDLGRTSTRFLWAVAAAAAFFSIDEGAAVHEAIHGLLVQFEAFPRFDGRSGTWIFVYGLLGLVLIALFLPGLVEFTRGHRRTSLRLIFGGGLFVLGGVGLEIVGHYTDQSLMDRILTLVEEPMEMAGVAVMIWAIYEDLGPTVIEFPALQDGQKSSRGPITERTGFGPESSTEPCPDRPSRPSR